MTDKYFGSHEFRDSAEVVKTGSDRNFGLVFAAVFAIIGLVGVFKHGAHWLYWLAGSAVFLVLAFAAPRILGPLNTVWMRFGLLLHTVVNPVILGIIFYACITPIGWLMRLTGKDPLRRRFEPAASSYWLPRDPPGPLPDSFPHQF